MPDHPSQGRSEILWIHKEPIVVNDDQTSPPRRRLRKSTETGSTPSAPSPSPVSGSASPMRRVRGKSTEKTVEQIYQKLEADVLWSVVFLKCFFFCFFLSLGGVFKDCLMFIPTWGYDATCLTFIKWVKTCWDHQAVLLFECMNYFCCCC